MLPTTKETMLALFDDLWAGIQEGDNLLALD
jgi:hypothetical protein